MNYYVCFLERASTLLAMEWGQNIPIDLYNQFFEYRLRIHEVILKDRKYYINAVDESHVVANKFDFINLKEYNLYFEAQNNLLKDFLEYMGYYVIK